MKANRARKRKKRHLLARLRREAIRMGLFKRYQHPSAEVLVETCGAMLPHLLH